ncbi:DNA polymerase III subunit beta [Robertmurraya massiliosenegalensis]|uniref:DNA polymerase III subunit beta n=1 Tax=Robertmurraya massiliosenegalensis TaxID=1287657 RepID=UPI00030F5A0E|nr:DNA polymerase III subunit beta [Robertmurraya massiliosenegalensis]
MKISVQKETMVTAINQVSKAVSARTTLPILTGIKLTSTDKGIELTGSDGDISITTFIPCEMNGDTLVEVEKDGSIVLQGKFFSDIIKKLPKDDLQINVDNLVSTIKSGKSKFTLNGLDSEEYPRLPVIDDENTITLSARKLKELIHQTVFAVSTSESRPVLTGVQWKVDSDVLIATATDSHRLSRREVAIKGLNEPVSVVVPGKSLVELNKVLEDTDEEVDIILEETQIIFRYRYLTFYTRLLEGNYPDTSRLIPTQSKTVLILNKAEYSESLSRASVLLASSKNKVVKMTINKDNMFIDLTAKAPEIGEVKDELLAISLEGDDLELSYSAKYMLDALKTMGNEIEIEFNGAMRPFVIREKGKSDLLQIVLPVRTY